jgi:hypothetical protein
MVRAARAFGLHVFYKTSLGIESLAFYLFRAQTVALVHTFQTEVFMGDG